MYEPVVKGAAYILAHTPNMAFEYGTTQYVERQKDPQSKYLMQFGDHLRTYEQVMNYAPFQAYIGNIHPDQLTAIDRPWYEGDKVEGKRYGKYGEIVPEDEFYAWLQLVDAFELVWLEEEFLTELKPRLEASPMLTAEDIKTMGGGRSLKEIQKRVEEKTAAPLMLKDRLVGCVRRAHELDSTLTAHVIAENTASKASGVLALRYLLKNTGVDPREIDYIIECSEEACGDMNQRGGGNLAKAIGEHAGCAGATGSDTRAFCAGPAHAMVLAAALVKAGMFSNVAVVAGGSTAKLGMNGKDHIKKGMPILEDVVGGFAVLISENDGHNPIIRTDSLGKHDIGTGSSPQAVMQALVTNPLDRLGLTMEDVDKYSVEMQVAEITEPAGAGDVPTANYRMIAALGVMKKQLERSAIPDFVARHGMPGFAPTQGHIPSGVPFVGHARDLILAGQMQRAMIIGKGSLFLARMTNLFDGISFLMEPNPGRTDDQAIDEGAVKKLIADALRQVALDLAQSED